MREVSTSNVWINVFFVQRDANNELGTTPQEGMIEKRQVHRRRMHTPVLRFVSANHKEQF
jgi:hypothetical protein